MADGQWAVGPLLAALAVVGATLLVATPARADTGGPDSYGYVWVDSRTPSPTVTYSWIDIVSSGVRLTNVQDDYCTFEVSLGFQFRYYGTIVNFIYICSNGFVTMSVPDSFSADPPIPSPAIPNSRVVALGMDLNPAASGSGGIYMLSQTSGVPKRFIITWNGVYKTYTTQPETFQIVLEQNETTKDGRIRFQYKSLTGISSPLVGIENDDGSSGLAYPKPLENNLAVQFLPPSDTTLPPDSLRVTGTSLAPNAVVQGAANVPMMAVDLSTATNTIEVTSLRVQLSGLGAGLEDVGSARLWNDSDGDGSLTIGPDALLKAVVLSGSPPVASFDLGSPIHLRTGSPRRLFITFNVRSDAGVGDWIGARIASASSVSVAFPDVVSSNGLPFDTYVANTRTRIDASQDSLRLTQATPLAPQDVEQWATDVPMLSLRFDADRNSVTLAGLGVSLGGNATAADAWAVKLIRDRDLDGNYTPGVDEVLGIGTASGTPARAMFPFTMTVSAGSPERILVVVDITPNATIGRVFNVTVNATDVLLAGGTPDTVDGTNFPAVAGNAAIVPGMRPALLLPWVDSPPQADGIWRADEYLLGPEHTVVLDRPAGNGVAAYVTAQNNATVLYVALDVVYDLVQDPPDGVTISFDTDADGAPTPGADNLYAANATGGARLLYNASAGGWTVAGACNPWAGNPGVSSCIAGRGATGLRPLPHRFYEFQIPLGELGVTLPIPPSTTVRFALAGLPHLGVVDGGNRSTWPILLGVAPPLAFYGDLVLSRGPAPNRAPYLDWVGTPGYETDGVDPDSGFPNETFVYRINYFDPDNSPPALGQPVLHILRDGSGIFGSPFPMAAADGRDANHLDGKEFLLVPSALTCGGNFTYRFAAHDALGLQNTTPTQAGPLVKCPNQPPVLFGESATPIVANAGSTFTYKIAYQDNEGSPPPFVEVEIRRGEVGLGNLTLPLLTFLGGVGDYAAGALYSGARTLADPGYNYTFRFRTSDGEAVTETSWFFGPYVLVPPPDVLTVAGVDLAPLVVDEGNRRVPFLQLYFLTSDDEVNVTSVRVDRVGSAGDLEVERILLYLDEDQSGTVNGNDRLLGSRPPLLGTAAFSVSLRVTPTNPVSIIFLLNITRPGTPDGTVGLEVKNTTYIGVGPGDLVQSFPAFRSTRSLVNVAPSAADTSVDGFPDGTPGVRHVVSDSPILSWRYSDPNSGDVSQAAFNASVWSASPLALLWYRNESGTGGSAPYTGPGLVDGRSYLLQVAVYDERLWSASQAALFRMNTPPPAPTQFAPQDLAQGIDPNATLLWQPVTDAEGDTITYWYWVDDDVGFGSPSAGVTPGPGITLELAEGTSYFWKVAASDGYEVTGNASVWRFTTFLSVPPVRGEVRGRVLNGTLPLEGALVELLVDGTVTFAAVTAANGTFRFLDLDLRAYVVRASAFGFTAKLVPAAPTETAPVVDLQDIVLERSTTGGNGGGLTSTEFPWLLLILAVIVASVLTSVLNLALFRRRRRSDEEQTEATADDEDPNV